VKIHFFSTKVGIAIREPGRLLVTQDGGAGWQEIPVAGWVRTFFFLSDEMGWVITNKSVYRAALQ